MATSRSGAGRKIVTNRRKQRLAATPYDRPPPPPPPKSPNWFTGVIVPSARAIASGAGKILSTIFSESESSSSEDEDSASEDDVDTDNCETPCNGVNVLNEKNVTPSELMQFGQESSLVMTETKRIIEQLIMHETFSREECDRLIKILNSRVMDWSVEAGEKISLAGSPGKMFDHEDVDVYSKAIQEAKKWFQEKKVGSSSASQLDHGTINLNLIGIEHVESGGGSPVDVARSYMKERPPWASPTTNVELRTPLTTKLFKEGTSYSVGRDSFSSSKKRNFLSSGSWNIQEELRRVRSKATEDMLRTPTAKIDASLLASQPIREETVAAGKVVPALGDRTSEPESSSKTKQIYALVDAGVSQDPDVLALESRPDCKASEAQSSKPATSVSGNNEDSGAVKVGGEHDASKFPHTSSPNHTDEHQTGGHSRETNGPPAIEATEFGGKQSMNGLSSSAASLSEGPITDQNNEQHKELNHNKVTVKEKSSLNTTNVSGNCELLSEAYMEVPIETETDSLESSLNAQNEELPVEIAQPSPKEKAHVPTGKQQGRKSGRYRGRGRGRGGGK